ncbi:MAG: hypothetical protein C4575_02295 [Desulforudis sp.]|nr:hypothetical protein [Clostridia bacterium]MDQ7791872.1 hypothetical protein [Clostridia bacterium]RJX22109.1 MAG: hypothetical protein C4575_02295 [Desulforudis sp.]
MAKQKQTRNKRVIAGQETQRVRSVNTRRGRQVKIFPTFLPILLFSGAILWVATERDTHPVAPMAFALLLGLMLAVLAPRHKVLTGSLPALGTFALLLVVQVGGGTTPFNEVATVWAPISLTGIIGALIGARLKIRL